MRRRTAFGLGLVTIALVLVLVPSAPAHGASSEGSPVAALAVQPAAYDPPNPFSDGMAADIAVGQPGLAMDVYAGTVNSSVIVPDPELPCMDGSGNLWVPNFGGSRVTEYTAPISTNESASMVLGAANFTSDAPGLSQSSFYGPASCTFDSHGNLWIPDFYNDRVLEFRPPFHTGMNASLVLGQTDFNSSVATVNQTGFAGPSSITFDSSGNLWVADAENNRVLEFVPPFHSGMNASIVLGQPNFYSSAAGTSATNLSFPIALAYGHGILWVSDYTNNRVIGFPAPFSNDEGAIYELGQQNFTVTSTAGATALAGPSGVSVDNRGDLWVSVSQQNRVLEYLPPFSTNETPAIVIGQPNFVTQTAADTATGLNYPLGAWVGPTGSLWVSDGQNDRVLGYSPAAYSLSFSETGLPAGASWNVSVNGATEAATAGGISLQEENGTYGWYVVPIAGYIATQSSGYAVVNGSAASVSLTFSPVDYSVVFDQAGLPAGTSWTVTVAGVAHSGGDGAAISLSMANGSYAYTVSVISGYNATPRSGTIAVAGDAQQVGVAFAASPSTGPGGSGSTGSGGSSSGGVSVLFAVLLGVVGLVVGAIVGVLIGRRRAGTPPPPPSSGAASVPPPASSGSNSAPVPPWSESPPSGGPPPGAA